MENCIKLKINVGYKNASNVQDKAIADVYRNKFIIPLDFEMLDSAAPYYQAGLGNRLCCLGSDDVIIPGTANLSFNVESISIVDANRTLVSNIGRAIIKKLAVN